MRKSVLMLALLLIGGCVADRGPDAEATAATSSRGSDDEGAGKPKQMCEHTSEGGVPKTFCY